MLGASGAFVRRHSMSAGEFDFQGVVLDDWKPTRSNVYLQNIAL